MKKFRPFALAFALGLAVAQPLAFAHEGHDEAPPATAPVAATSEGHKHDSPHGGIVKAVGNYHFELGLGPKILTVWLLDGAMKPLPPAGKSGQILIQQQGKKKLALPLLDAGDHFEAKADLAGAKSFIAIVSLNLDGKKQSGRFSYKKEK